MLISLEITRYSTEYSIQFEERTAASVDHPSGHLCVLLSSAGPPTSRPLLTHLSPTSPRPPDLSTDFPSRHVLQHVQGPPLLIVGPLLGAPTSSTRFGPMAEEFPGSTTWTLTDPQDHQTPTQNRNDAPQLTQRHNRACILCEYPLCMFASTRRQEWLLEWA
jgi:hypothetical protein